MYFKGLLTIDKIKYIILTGIKAKGIKRIILGNTCEISNIPLELFKGLPELEEIVLCRSVEYIDDETLIECIRKDDKGEYFNVDNPCLWNVHKEKETDRRVRIKFNINL